MNIQKPEREEFIKNLSTSIENANAHVNTLLETLGWSKEKIIDDTRESRNLVPCPFNKDHHVASDRLEEHKKVCELRSCGFNHIPTKDLPDSSSFFYQNASSSVNQIFVGKEQIDSLGLCMKRQGISGIDEAERRQQATKEQKDFSSETGDAEKSETRSPSLSKALFNLPACYLETLLSVDDRVKLYQHVVETGKSMRRGKAFSFDELEQDAVEQQKVLEMQEQLDEDRPKSKVEALAELRDYKRRRQTYRAKNPILSKTSATVVIRELIDEQMKYLEIVSTSKSKKGETDQGEIANNTLNGGDRDTAQVRTSSDRLDIESSRSGNKDFPEKDFSYSEIDSRTDYERVRRGGERFRKRSRDRRDRSQSRERCFGDYGPREIRKRDRWRGRDRDLDRNRNERDSGRDWDCSRGSNERYLPGRKNETDDIQSEVAQNLKNIREGIDSSHEKTRKADVGDFETYESKMRRLDEDENAESGGERRRRKVKRKSSRSLSRSRSRERYRHKHKKHKEKKKKKRRREEDDDEAGYFELKEEDQHDEWVEKS